MKIDFMKDCKKVELGEICEMFSGGTPDSENKDYYNGDIPFIRSAEISGNKTLLYLSESGYNNSSAKMVDYGDLLYALYGANSGECAISKQCGAINQAILCIRSKNESISYIYYILLNKKKRIISKYLQGGQGNLSAAIIKKIKINLPPIEEQEKIAEILSTQDKLIELKQDLINQKKQQKKWLMQKIFSQELRFKCEDGTEFPHWENIEFGSIIKEFKEKTTKENEDILLSSAINGMYLNSELFGHQRGKSTKGYLKIKYGTLILSTQNLHLGNANVNLRFEHGIISPAYKTYKIQHCNIYFISQWIKREETNQFFYDATTTGASQCRRNVNWNTLYRQTLLLPCFEEQQKIAEILSSQDKEIELLEKELEQEKLKKKALMQLLLTVK